MTNDSATMERTQLTAAASQPSTRSPGKSEFLTFNLGDEEYGIDILKVQEIRGYEQATFMAGTPGFVKGVVNLRGVIVPILDLRLRFGLPDVRYGASTVTVILTLLDRIVGVVVDSVSDVIELTPNQIKPVPELSGNISASCITGMGSIEQAGVERMLILLNIEKLMSGSDMGLVHADQHA